MFVKGVVDPTHSLKILWISFIFFVCFVGFGEGEVAYSSLFFVWVTNMWCDV